MLGVIRKMARSALQGCSSISLSFDYIPGGLVLAIVSFSAMGIGLIVWSGSPTADSRPTAEADGRFGTEPAEDQKPAANQPTR